VISGPQYRCYYGEIQMRTLQGTWIRSAHDEARSSELATYEREEHPAAPALRVKFRDAEGK
jgi:hypothetical protein